jgi:hypothetical protein
VSEDEARQLLADLVALRGDLDDLLDRVGRLPWDRYDDLVTVRRDDLRHACEEYRNGRLSAERLEAWAEMLDTRDEIAYAGEDTELISTAVFRLSTPELEGRTATVVASLLGELAARTC